MKAVWNTETEGYEITFTAKELAITRLALFMRSQESFDPDVAKLWQDLVNLENVEVRK